MSYRRLGLAPQSSLPEERRGRIGGRFCRACGAVYPRFAARHAGKPMYGKDHVSSPCSNEGELFSTDSDWWESAVEILPEPPTAAEVTGSS